VRAVMVEIKKRGNMENVKVKKADALEILKKNQAEHKSIFLEAVEGYKKQVLEILEKNIADIKAGKVQYVSVQLPRPEEHTKDYNRALKMLEMTVDEVIEMDEHSFSSYIMDDWSWKRQFLGSNMTYSAKASSDFAGYAG
jgi:hypothetical protein